MSTRLPCSIHEWLHATADERDVSVNFLVIRAVENYIDQSIPIEQLT